MRKAQKDILCNTSPREPIQVWLKPKKTYCALIKDLAQYMIVATNLHQEGIILRGTCFHVLRSVLWNVLRSVLRNVLRSVLRNVLGSVLRHVLRSGKLLLL